MCTFTSVKSSKKRNLDVGQLDLRCILFRSTSVFISFTSPTGFTQGTCNLSSKALSVCVWCECIGGDHLLLKDSPMHSCWKMKIQVQTLRCFAVVFPVFVSRGCMCLCVSLCSCERGAVRLLSPWLLLRGLLLCYGDEAASVH